MSARPPDSELLVSHAAFVRSVARAALGVDGEAEDVAQDALVAALQHGPGKPRSLKAWLARVTRRQAALSIRRRTRERSRIERAGRVRSRERAGAESAADSVARAETGRRLVWAVLALPEIYRDVLLLRYLEELPPREVASRLDVPVETVRTRTRRGLDLLRERLEESGQRRGADWRASLLALLPRSSCDVSTSVSAMSGTAAGVVLMKKAIVAVVVVLVLGAASLWSAGAFEPDRPGDAARTLVPVGSGTDEAATLAGRGPVDPGVVAALPAPVDLAVVDRERDVHGLVVDAATDAPLGGTEIRLVEAPWSRSASLDGSHTDEHRIRATTRAARDGTWRVRLEPGESPALQVEARGYAPVEVHNVQAGERVDLRLERGVGLRVRVVDARGQVVTGASVRLFRSTGMHRRGIGFPDVGGVTDGEGVWLAGGLPPGKAANVAVVHPELGAAMWREIRFATTGVGDVEIRIPPARVLTGRVTDARSGAPIAGAKVGIGWIFQSPVRTDADGFYTLPGWTQQGVYEIAVRAPGYAYDEALVEARQRIDFALQPGDRIRGRVVDGVGRPLAGALVSAVGSSRETGRQVTSSATAVADAGGRFELADLRHDMLHTVVLVAPGWGRTLYDVPPAEVAGGVRDVGDLPISAAGMLAGVVREADGAPATRLLVSVEGANADRGRLAADGLAVDHRYGTEDTRFTDDLGRFRFRDMAPGTYTLTVRLRGGGELTRDVVIPAHTLRADVTLNDAARRTFLVRVRDTHGDAIDQALVWLTTVSGERLTASSGADGVTRFDVADDPETVEVHTSFDLSRKRYLPVPEQRVPPGADELVVTFTPAAAISGCVLDEGDRPLARVTLRAVTEGRVLDSSWTRADGTWVLVVPVRATVDVELEGTRLEEWAGGFVARAAFVRGRVEAVAAGSEGVILRAATVAQDGVLTVLVTDPSGTPLADAMVYVNQPGGTVVTKGRTGSEGKVVLRDLPDAILEVRAARAPAARDEPWVIPVARHLRPRGQLLTLAYRPGARIAGVVVGADGSPVAGLRVAVEHAEGTYETTTDEAGRFEARVPADAADVAIRLLEDGASDADANTVHARPGETGLRLRLAR